MYGNWDAERLHVNLTRWSRCRAHTCPRSISRAADAPSPASLSGCRGAAERPERLHSQVETHPSPLALHLLSFARSLPAAPCWRWSSRARGGLQVEDAAGLEEEGDAPAGGSLTLLHRRRHVDVHPLSCVVRGEVRLDEVACTRGECVVAVIGAVLHVRHLAGERLHEDLRAVDDGVDEVARRQPCPHETLFGGKVVAEEGSVLLACRHRLRACQRRHVENQGRLENASCVKHAVPEHEPALGVGVVDLHGLAGHEGDDVVGAHCNRVHRVLGEAEEGVQPVGHPDLHRSFEGAKDGS
mmetsp:Transcript_3877/g.9443  ORF Transcript_3877/g.9443 Transcript_3877/m.9443 type:complete len:298 (+) Transcript_3877:43-936(+)